MTTKTVRAGKTATGNGTIAGGDIVSLQGGAGGYGAGSAGGTLLVTTMLDNAGVIRVQGGVSGTTSEQAGGQGGLLDVVGVLTDTGSIVVRAGQAGYGTAAEAGQGGRLVVSGTLSIEAAGSLTLQGGTSNGFDAFATKGTPNGGTLVNAGLLNNASIITLEGGAGGSYFGPAGFGSELINAGTLSNSGTILLQSGKGGFDNYSGTSASLFDNGVLTNSGEIEVGGGVSSLYLGHGAYGATLTVSGMLANSGTLLLDGGGAGGDNYVIGSGGTLLDLGTVENTGTIEVAAGRSFEFAQDGLGSQFVDSGVLTNNGIIRIDGSQTSFYQAASGGTMIVTGLLNSYGQIRIAGGGGDAALGGYYPGNGGVLVDSGTVEISRGTFVVGGGQASSGIRQAGGHGGTLSIAKGANFINDSRSPIIIQGGAGASVSGRNAGGQGGVLDLAGMMSGTSPITLQAGSAGQAGDASGAGASMVVSGLLYLGGALTIGSGSGSASASLTVTRGGVIKCDNINSLIENDGVTTLQAGATIGSFGLGMLRNTGTISGAGTISSLPLINDGTIDAGSGQLMLIGDAITSDSASGLLKAGIGGTLTVSGGSIDASQSVILAGAAATLAVTAGDAGVLVNSSTGGAVDITGGGTAILNTADTNLSVFLSSATNLTLSRMGAIAATGSVGADTITAMASGQTLTGGLGADLLTGAAATGDIFRDIAAGLNGDTIAGFAGTDTIDITDFAPGAGLTLGYTQQGAAGTLTLSENSATTTITLQGQFTAASFTTASDLHGGVLISLHG